MSRDGHTIHGSAGTIRIDGGALSALVIAAAELVDGARVRRPRRGLDVVVTDGKAHVELETYLQRLDPLAIMGVGNAALEANIRALSPAIELALPYSAMPVTQ